MRRHPTRATWHPRDSSFQTARRSDGRLGTVGCTSPDSRARVVDPREADKGHMPVAAKQNSGALNMFLTPGLAPSERPARLLSPSTELELVCDAIHENRNKECRHSTTPVERKRGESRSSRQGRLAVMAESLRLQLP